MMIRLLVRYCIGARIRIPGELDAYKPRPKKARERPTRSNALMTALGLKMNRSRHSIKYYSGNYLLFMLDTEGNVAVSSYVLSRDLGDDGAPIFQARRKVEKHATVNFVGAYFANEHQLYLVGTPRGSLELRLSILHIIHQARQTMVRGVNLRVSNGMIIATRCILVRADFKPTIRHELLVGTHPKARIEQFFHRAGESLKDDLGNLRYPQSDSDGVDLREVAEYLFDEKASLGGPPYLKVPAKLDG